MNIESNYGNESNNNIKSNKPAFKGAIGTRLLKEIAEGDSVELSKMVKEAKGTFGFNKEKVRDIVESFVNKIKESQESLPGKNKEYNKLYEESKNLPDDMQIRDNAWQSVRSSYAETYKEFDKKEADVGQRLEAAQTKAKKYEPMKEVKSIEEIGVIMPEKVIELIDEADANVDSAAESMYKFLVRNGDGKEAMAQVDRYKKLYEARQNGMYGIPEVAEHAEGKCAPSYHPIPATIDNIIKMALKGNKEGSYLGDYGYRDQMKDRAMVFLKPLYENSKDYKEYDVREMVEKALADVLDFHINFPKGKNQLIRNYRGFKIVDNNLGYNTAKSNIEAINDDGRKMSWTYDELAWAGSHIR